MSTVLREFARSRRCSLKRRPRRCRADRTARSRGLFRPDVAFIRLVVAAEIGLGCFGLVMHLDMVS